MEPSKGTHRSHRGRLAIAGLAATLVAAVIAPGSAAARSPQAGAKASGPETVRFSTFNASLNRFAEGQLVADLSTPGNAQAQAVAEIIQRARPDVLLINEFDYDEGGEAADLFRANYLAVGQGGAEPITYPFAFQAPSNTGVLPEAPVDFDNNGRSNTLPGDAFGFGFFPGQFGMLVLSRYPIDEAAVRTFRNFLWRDMPGALLPDDPATPEPGDYYSTAELDVFRLSSKSHWDVPIEVGKKTVHFLVSHPTPPVFDHPTIDQNGRRNSDEIRLWADYVRPGRGDYLVDDDGRSGGLQPGSAFVIAGDQNADPLDGDSFPGAIQQLLASPRISTKTTPSSAGAVEQSALQGGVNGEHRSDPAFDTADFGEPPGNLRADYVLPSKQLKVTDAEVFWPTTDSPFFDLVGTFPFPSSDHRLVWIDVKVPGFHG